MHDAFRDAAITAGLWIVLLLERPPGRFDSTLVDRSIGEIDRLGFQPHQRCEWSADCACSIRHRAADAPLHRVESEPEQPWFTGFSVDRATGRGGAGLRLSIQPLIERVDVIRARAPARRSNLAEVMRWPTPLPIHGLNASWRAHLAGCRAAGHGVATEVLCAAGRVMGYHVRCRHDPARVGAGRLAWSQVLFTRPQPGERAPSVSAAIPFGEADVLLGMDGEEALRAIDPIGRERVAHAERTSAVVNLGSFEGESDSELERAVRGRIALELARVTRRDSLWTDDFAAACRLEFQTDRVTDLAIIGLAFQRGLIPVSLEAMEQSLRGIDARGMGRSLEAFQFGRSLAMGERTALRSMDPEEADPGRLARTLSRMMAVERRGGRQRAARFSFLARSGLAHLDALANSDDGRQALGDFVNTLLRCAWWGGIEYAEQYAQLIVDLQGDRTTPVDAALVVAAVLPLGDAMLPRDLGFVATAAASMVHRRRVRGWLNARAARGDRLERRFFTAVRLEAFGRRVRFTMRTSDWPVRAVAAVSRCTPRRWRGNARQRQVRELVVNLVRRASWAPAEERAQLLPVFERLHAEALTGGLQHAAPAEVKMLIEAGGIGVKGSAAGRSSLQVAGDV
jgi:Pyruvate/2-oxoacid:ferredoxin oxidoreductase gamma subunit